MGNLGPTEIIIIALVIIVLFGASRLPTAARSIGRSMRIFKAETKGLREDDDSEDKPTAQPPSQALPPVQQQAERQQPQVAPAVEQTQSRNDSR